MLYKKFRNDEFYKGDLVEPNWKPINPIGLGVIIDIKQHRHVGQKITVCWQLVGISIENAMDLKLVEATID